LNFIDENTGLPTKGSYAWDELTEGNFQEARFGLEFTPPAFGARREHAGVRNAELNLARERARLEDMELNTSHLLTTAIQNLDFHYKSALSHWNRWIAAESEVEALFALVRGGKATVDLVLDGQRRRASAQADFYRALIEYNKAIAQVHFRKGSLLAYNNVQLSEGPWPKKAYWDALGQARQRDASAYLDYGSTRPRVISRGPIDQGGGDVLMEDGLPSLDMDGMMESIPTPAPTDASGLPLMEPMDEQLWDLEDPDATAPVFEGPSFELGDAPPAPRGGSTSNVALAAGWAADEQAAPVVAPSRQPRPAR
jgi:hypothetical protein